MDEVRESLIGYPGVQITVDQNSDGPPTGKPISIEIRGDDFEELVRISESMENFINESGIKGLKN